MFQNKKVVVVMPAYNAEKTLLKTYEEVMAQGIVDWLFLSTTPVLTIPRKWRRVFR